MKNNFFKQWGTFAQVWHIYDCKWQNPFQSAELIKRHLLGLHKPIYHPMSEFLVVQLVFLKHFILNDFYMKYFLPFDNKNFYNNSIVNSDYCGDQIVCINTKDIALPGSEWTKRSYFHHTGYPGNN